MKIKLLLAILILPLLVLSQTTTVNEAKTKYLNGVALPSSDSPTQTDVGSLNHYPTIDKLGYRGNSIWRNLANETWVSANYVPIGSNSYIINGTSVQPSSNFNISGGGTLGGGFSIGTPITTYKLEVLGLNSSVALFTNTAALGVFSGPVIKLAANNTPTAANQRFGSLSWGTSTETNSAASIDVFSEGIHTANSSQSTYMSFYTTPSGSATKIEAIRINSLGNLNLLFAPSGINDAVRLQDIARPANYTASGNGSATTISIPHGLTGVTANSAVNVSPRNPASAGISYVTSDATNINIIYTVAPASGVQNLLYTISIRP